LVETVKVVIRLHPQFFQGGKNYSIFFLRFSKMSLNSIEEISEDMGESTADFTLLAMTFLMSCTAAGFGFFYLKEQLKLMKETKQDIDSANELEDSVYQSWNGTYADGENSLVVTLVRKNLRSKGENESWVDWDGSNDPSVVSRNFYLGNLSPSFEWKVEPREFDIKATIREIMIDGWDSVIEMKVTAFVNNTYESSEQLNSYLQKLVVENKIEWQKNVIDIREYNDMFT
jgi:hypothetical protein